MMDASASALVPRASGVQYMLPLDVWTLIFSCQVVLHLRRWVDPRRRDPVRLSVDIAVPCTGRVPNMEAGLVTHVS